MAAVLFLQATHICSKCDIVGDMNCDAFGISIRQRRAIFGVCTIMPISRGLLVFNIK